MTRRQLLLNLREWHGNRRLRYFALFNGLLLQGHNIVRVDWEGVVDLKCRLASGRDPHYVRWREDDEIARASDQLGEVFDAHDIAANLSAYQDKLLRQLLAPIK